MPNLPAALNQAAAFAKGTMSAEERDEWRDHIRSSKACRDLTIESWREEICRQIQPGSRVGRYVVLKRIGEGGMGVVFAAYDPNLDRRIALKFIWSLCPNETDAKREGKLMARVKHPNVVTVYDAGVWNGSIFIAMELIETVSFEDWLAERRASKKGLPLRTLSDALREFGSALREAHRMGILHRDLKLANVLLMVQPLSQKRSFFTLLKRQPEEFFMLKLSDFGIARPIEDAPPEGSQSGPKGTPDWMAPEIAAAETPDQRADVYGFCAIVLKVFTGKTPVMSSKGSALDGVDPASLQNLPGWLHGFLRKGLQMKREDRFRTMDETLHEFDRRRFQRRRATAWATAVASACIVVGATVAYISNGSAKSCDLAKWENAWTDTDRTAIQTAFTSTREDRALQNLQRVDEILGQYIATWRSSAEKVCAQRDAGVAAQDIHEQVICLERGRKSFDFLLNTFRGADRHIIAGSIRAATKLPDSRKCFDARVPVKLAANYSASVEPALSERRAKHDEILQRLEEVRLLRELGNLTEVEREVERLEAEARSLGLFEASAHAGMELLITALKLRKYETVKLKAPFVASMASLARSNNLLAAAFDIELWVLDVVFEDLARTTELRRMLEVMLQEYEGIADVTRADAHETLSAHYEKHNDLNAAVEHARRALNIRKGIFGPESYRVAVAAHNLGFALRKVGNCAEAFEKHREAARLFEHVYGQRHPHVVQARTYMGVNLLEQGRFEEALDVLREARRVGGTLEGQGSAPALILGYLGDTLFALGRIEESHKSYMAALDLFLERNPPGFARTNMARIGLANVAISRGHLPAARAHLRTAIDVLEKKPAERALLGQAYFAMSRCAKSQENALAWAQKARNTLQGEQSRSAMRTLKAVDGWFVSKL